MDSFEFSVSDGVWTSADPATVTCYVVAGPILTTPCNPFGTGVWLNWALDSAVQQMGQLNINHFIVYRSAAPGGPYTPIQTNGPGQLSYLDPSAVAGQTNYYVGHFYVLG